MRKSSGEYSLGPIFVRSNYFAICIPEPGDLPDPEEWKRQIEGQEGVAYLYGHQHVFDHTTICLRGAGVVWSRPPGSNAWSPPMPVRAPPRDWPMPTWEYPGSFRFIAKNVFHIIVATEPNTEMGCFLAHRNELGEVVEEIEYFPGYMRAYW